MRIQPAIVMVKTIHRQRLNTGSSGSCCARYSQKVVRVDFPSPAERKEKPQYAAADLPSVGCQHTQQRFMHAFYLFIMVRACTFSPFTVNSIFTALIPLGGRYCQRQRRFDHPAKTRLCQTAKSANFIAFNAS